MKRLSHNFFEQNTLKVAQQLLGKFLIRKVHGKKIIALITETEAYHGPNDLASHASKGRTPRTEVMFGPAGRAYVYLIYGMYYCFNVVTGNVDYPAAVLIRGIYLVNSKRLVHGFRPWVQDNIITGPGKVCRELKIDKNLNKENLLKSDKLIVVEDKRLLKKICSNDFKIKKASRVGVDYAGEYKDKLWRYILK